MRKTRQVATRGTRGTRESKARVRGVAEPIARSGSNRGEVVLYRAPNGTVTLDVRLDRDTIWLSLNQMAELFDRDKSVVARHLSNVFKEKESERVSTVAFLATVQNEAGREVTRQVEFYNIDAILSVGYQAKSKSGASALARARTRSESQRGLAKKREIVKTATIVYDRPEAKL